MYGKYFASTFTGSMVGAGCNVFALWGYCIANGTGGQVELNPVIIATMMGCTSKEIETAIEFLCAPDLKSRSNLEDGRRLIKVGAFAYDIPNYHRYRSIVNEEDRRDYNRRKQAEHRNRVKPCQTICQSSGGSSASPSVSASASASVPEGGSKGETEIPNKEPKAMLNHPPLKECQQHFRKCSDYTGEQVRQAFQQFEASTCDGMWMWGKRQVTDWRSAMESRMSDNRARSDRIVSAPGGRSPKTAAQAMTDDLENLVNRANRAVGKT